MKLLIKNILVGIAVIPLFFHIIILCVNVLCGNVEIRDDISHYKSRKSIKYNLFFTFVYLMLIFQNFVISSICGWEDFGVIFYFGFHLYQLYIYGHLLLELEVGYTSVMVGVQ